MQILPLHSEAEWEQFLQSPARTDPFGPGGQSWPPFLQSITMGEVYRRVGQEPIRLEIRNLKSEARNKSEIRNNNEEIVGICQAIVVPAKRGKHLAIPYGPVMAKSEIPASPAGGRNPKSEIEAVRLIVDVLRKVAVEKGCSFIRLSPFWAKQESGEFLEELSKLGFRPSPLHLLAEHIWYLDLKGRIAEGVLMGMRATTRNLVRRAAREGVVVQPSSNPVRDFSQFWKLYENTGERHGFVLYPRDLLLAQLEMFCLKDQAKLYLAKLNGEVLAASIHISYGGVTSYHHGASADTKVPASYLLQWRAIQDAMMRGDRIYNFWGIAPAQSAGPLQATSYPSDSAEAGKLQARHHPFAGVTTFKTGFGGELLELVHCMDLPLTSRYLLTWSVEKMRKVQRGF